MPGTRLGEENKQQVRRQQDGDLNQGNGCAAVSVTLSVRLLTLYVHKDAVESLQCIDDSSSPGSVSSLRTAVVRGRLLDILLVTVLLLTEWQRGLILTYSNLFPLFWP